MDQEFKDWTKQDLIDTLRDQDKEMFDLIAKCVELINKIGWGDDDTYTFNDGDRWNKFDPMEEYDDDNYSTGC